MTNPATAEGDPPLVRRSTTRARFTNRTPPEPEAGPGGAQSIVGTPVPKSERLTDRRRQISGDLPSWDLLPPGELNVRRK